MWPSVDLPKNRTSQLHSSHLPHFDFNQLSAFRVQLQRMDLMNARGAYRDTLPSCRALHRCGSAEDFSSDHFLLGRFLYAKVASIMSSVQWIQAECFRGVRSSYCYAVNRRYISQHRSAPCRISTHNNSPQASFLKASILPTS